MTENENGKAKSDRKKIRVAIVGVGNCASSLIQGRYYENASETDFIHNETFVGTETLAKRVMPKAPARGGKPIAKQRTNSPPATRRG